MKLVTIRIGSTEFVAEIHDTPTGRAIIESLPFKATANTWGDEIYFQVPARVKLEPGATVGVSVGDLAYWPTMPAFCIFFGPTPASYDEQPRAASAVNVFGRMVQVDLDRLQAVQDGDEIKVSLYKDIASQH